MRSQHGSIRTIRPVRQFLWYIALVAVCDSRLAAERFPEDPVEKFKQALQVENNKNLRYKSKLEEDPAALKNALQFRQDHLERTAKNLRTASEISRALLLIDWPRPPKNKVERDAETKYDRGARDIEGKVRDELITRLLRGVRETFRRPALSDDAATRQIATANLIGETVASSSDPTDDLLLNLYRTMQPVAKDLATLTTTPRFRVREAAARALGQFPNSPKVAADALQRLLSRDNPESTRKTAADALSTLALNVSTNQPIRGSEPGVAVRDTRRPGKIFELEEVVALVRQVARAAATGLDDPSDAVRRSSVNALRQASEALAFEVRGLIPTSAKDIELPPPDRPWSKEEASRIADRRKEVVEQEKLVTPALRAFRNQGSALMKAALDKDPEVRLNARRTLNSLAATRELLQKLHDSVPTRPAAGGEAADMAGELRFAPPPVVGHSGVGTLVSRRQEKDKAKDDKAKDDKADPDKADKPPVDKEDEDDKDPDPIGTLLRSVGEGLVREGYRDPNAEARRATHETIEAMGPAGAQFIPQLVISLKDKDLFVRWIAARTLSKLAPRMPATVLPALVCQLDDEDLDPRIAAAKAIGQYGPDASGVVPALVERLHKGDVEFRIAVMKAVEGIGTSAASALPSIAKALDHLDPRVRGEAARVLGRFGPLSRDHVAALRKLSDDPDAEVRRAASGAILSIVAD